MRHEIHHSRILLRLRELAQLFNSLDPSPFVERDLDADAEEFILSWARELPKRDKLELVLHLASAPEPERAAGVEEAVQHYFATRREIKRREFGVLMRRGRLSLIVGLVFLAACLSGSHFLSSRSGTAFDIVREGLVILGWVAMWRPLEIYLYDWWPLWDDLGILNRLAHIRVKQVNPGQQMPSPTSWVAPAVAPPSPGRRASYSPRPG